jgi:hypothetical protein
LAVFTSQLCFPLQRQLTFTQITASSDIQSGTQCSAETPQNSTATFV